MKPVSFFPRSGWLDLACGLALLATSAPAATNYLVTFDREQYVIRGGETFPVQVLINPAPTNGLYSFGVELRIDSTNARISGVGAVAVPADYSFDGPRALLPVVAVESNSAAVKGTVEFHSSGTHPSSNALLTTFYVTDLGPGPYDLKLGFFNTLGATENIFVDGAGAILDAGLAFTTASVVRGGKLDLGLLSPIALNRQTGLFEQDIIATNNLSTTVAGLRILVTNLPPTWVVRNATGQTNGLPYLLHNFSVAPGQSVQLRVQYRIPDRNPNAQPGYLVEALYSPEFPPQPAGSSFVVSPRLTLADGSFLLEFSSLLDRSYSIQYGRAMSNWITIVPALRGNGSRVQWIDYGPPKTEKPPLLESQRFYRVILLP